MMYNCHLFLIVDLLFWCNLLTFGVILINVRSVQYHFCGEENKTIKEEERTCVWVCVWFFEIELVKVDVCGCVLCMHVNTKICLFSFYL